MEEKLITEQPATVTYQGKVENVVCKTKKEVLTDATNNEEGQILLNEGPSDGITIISE